ncbi:MAG: hypothetical protein RBJ76_13225 [Stenomitos frigidus ULC029]
MNPNIIDHIVYSKLGSFIAQYRDLRQAQERLNDVPGGYIQAKPMMLYLDCPVA